MKTLGYKKNTSDVLYRLKTLFKNHDQSRIYASMNIPNKALEEYKKNNIEGNCYYPKPSERILFWDKILRERESLLDDSIPCAYLSEMDQGLYGGIFGGDVRFLCFPSTGLISSMTYPILNNLEELDKLRFDKNNEWYRRYIEQLELFVKGSSNNFGISHLVVLDGLNFIFELIGATKTYMSLIEQPDLVQKAIDFAYNLNIEIQSDFFNRVQLLDNGTFSIEAGWIPGRIVMESVDPFHMTSLEYFEKWGKPTIERIFKKFDGGIIHIHSNGHHLIKAISQIKGIKAISIYNDGASTLTIKDLKLIKKETGSVPLIFELKQIDFEQGLKDHTLTGGVLYKVNEVFDKDCANRLMDKVRDYKV